MSPNASRLSAVTKDLLVQWQQTKEYWTDVKSLEFERKYLEELKAGVDSAVTIIEKLDTLLTKIRKDCE
jgi:hypothetical protein